MVDLVTLRNDWQNVAGALGWIFPVLGPIVQGLGRLDAQLTEADSIFLKRPTSDRLAGADHLFLSQLWVIGGYELVRTLDQRCRTRPHPFLQPIAVGLHDTKRSFERVRIPLAKLEPAQRHRDSDFAIPGPAFSDELGVGWLVSPTTIISRRELADELLSVLAGARFSDHSA